MDSVFNKIENWKKEGRKVVFISGNFNVVHLGHIRLFEFAQSCGDKLVVGITHDNTDGTSIPSELRKEGVENIGLVDCAFILEKGIEHFLQNACPNIVVKGSEHRDLSNIEEKCIKSYGGELIFSSGEARLPKSYFREIKSEETQFEKINHATNYLERHKISKNELVGYLEKFKDLKAIVIGDVIVDEYINCDPLGMSQEDPTLVVSPISRDRFLGGAGIVAAHMRKLGAQVSYFCVCGDDEAKNYVADKTKQYGVHTNLYIDKSRPTTLKQRFRAHNKTLLRVSHLRQHDISQDIISDIIIKIEDQLSMTDMVIFSDFNYGCLPQSLVNSITKACQKYKIPMIADSQSSSQYSDISRFHNMDLVTPTEREARLATKDAKSGLIVLADQLRQKANIKNIIVTLAEEGMLIHAPERNTDELITDRLPAFCKVPRDVSGAGDALLASVSLAMSTGANIWEAAYIAAVAASFQVSRIGNRPLEPELIKKGLLQ